MKTLIAYFTWSNNTKTIVKKINREMKCDVLQIERKIPYSTDYHTCAYVEAKEEAEKKLFPEIEELHVNVREYDRVLLFFPIWWYTLPMPVATFVKQIRDYQGEVIVFENSYTNDPQYPVNVMRDLRSIAPEVNFREGLFNQPVKKHLEFLKERGI